MERRSLRQALSPPNRHNGEEIFRFEHGNLSPTTSGKRGFVLLLSVLRFRSAIYEMNCRPLLNVRIMGEKIVRHQMVKADVNENLWN